jgi:hypothetical protein
VFGGTFLFNGASSVEVIGGVAQMPHEWLQGSQIHPHIHWAKSTSAAGGVVWQLRYSIADPGGTFGTYSEWVSCTNPVPDSDTIHKQAIAAFPYIDMTAFGLSAVILWEVRRDPTDVADTYDADARFCEFDIHYQKSGLGSLVEF